MAYGDAQLADSESRCGNCHVLLRSDSRFCHRCGAAGAGASSSVRPQVRRSSFPSLRSLDEDVKLVAILFAALLFLWGSISLIQPPSVLVDLSGTAVSCALILQFCNQDRQRILPMLAWGSWTPDFVRRMVLTTLVLFPFLVGYFWFVERMGFEVLTTQELEPHMPTTVIVITSCLVAPVAEELCFRGYILGKLERTLGPTDALVIQAALFSVLHLAPMSFVSHFIIGLALGQLARTTRSLYPSMAVHAAWNALVLLTES